MLANFFSTGLDLFAFVLPISIAVTNIIFFPLAAVWLFGARWTFPRWPPLWGGPEKWFLAFLGISLLSAILGVDIRHSLKEIKNKDFYILIMIVLVALVRDADHNARLLKWFMMAGLLTAVWGLIQCAIGINQTDKSGGVFLHLPVFAAAWPRPLLDHLSMVDGRVLGTRGHPLAYAECLLFNWAFALTFLLIRRGRLLLCWALATLVIGAALLTSQSRGPWIAAALITVLAMGLSQTRRSGYLLGVGILFAVIYAAVPTLRQRAASNLDRSHHSNFERMHMWRVGWQMVKARPLLGVGPGNVKTVSADFQNAEEKQWGSWGHLHSIYVNFTVERGLLGSAAFFLFVASLFGELWQALRRSEGDPSREAIFQAAILGMAGFLISGFTETVYNTAVVMMTFYFVIGLALALARHTRPVHV
jgi:putative inorganic carbon (HCO3(-)) transporter